MFLPAYLLTQTTRTGASLTNREPSSDTSKLNAATITARFIKPINILAMRTHLLPTLLGLTTTVSICTSLGVHSVQAATFNYDQLKNISTRPINSGNTITFSGTPDQNQGYTAFSNLDSTALDFGHQVTSLNGSGNSPYYVTGREGSPEVPPSGATRATTTTEIAGFPVFSSYLKNNGIPLDSIGFGFGPKSDRSFNKTWNLGNDRLGEDWFASPDSTIEEKIYKANPDDVEEYISFGNEKIVNLGYSNIYAAIDYGPTKAFSDDKDVALTDPTTATKVTGLDPVGDALANAFLQDVAAAGNKVQLVHEEDQPDENNFAIGNGFGGINLRFGASIAAVPEPSSALGFLIFGALGTVSYLKKQKQL